MEKNMSNSNFTLNDLVSEFGFDEYSFYKLKNLIGAYCAKSFNEKLDDASNHLEKDFSPSVVVKSFSLKEINKFLKRNPEYYNRKISEEFDFSMLDLSKYKDNHFVIVENEIYVISY